MAKEHIDREKFKHLFEPEYESPIRLIETDIYTQMRKQQENDIFEAILKYGIDVDKEELLKALKYDRGQYEKGFQDAMRTIEKADVVEVVRCKGCKFFEEAHYENESELPKIKSVCRLFKRTLSSEDFCSYGERNVIDNG